MSKEMTSRMKDLKPLLGKMRCQDHPAYYATHFCKRKNCGYGLVCEACEELNHQSLRHHSLDGIAMDNLMEVKDFIDQVFDQGLHYEEREELFPNCSKEQAKLFLKGRLELEKMKEEKSKQLKESLENLHAEVSQRIALRFKKLQVDLSEELEKAFDAEIRPLAYFVQAAENIARKREFSMVRLLDELEFAKIFSEKPSSVKKSKKSPEPEALDMQKCSLAFQGHLDGTYNYLDIKYMKEMRQALAYLTDGHTKVKVDIDGLASKINKFVISEMEQVFSNILNVTTIENGGLERLIARSLYPNNVAKNISGTDPEIRKTDLGSRTLDHRVRIGHGSRITRICGLNNRYILVGQQNGILKVGSG